MDTLLRSGNPLPPDKFLPVCYQGEVNQIGVSSQPVIEHFDVLSDLDHGFLPGAILAVMNPLPLECVEEVLY